MSIIMWRPFLRKLNAIRHSKCHFGNASGLIVSGTAQVAVVNGKLDAIIYLAPQEYYRDLRQGEVESILRSVTLL
jgi:hypothetical protein